VKVYVVHAHPSPDSFSAVCLERTVASLRNAGHEVRVTSLYADDFDPVLSLAERIGHLDPPDTKPQIASYVELLHWCEALVLVYPTWFSSPPAMLKGWIDRVWVNGVAYDLPPDGNRIRARLHNIRRLVVVTTHGSSKLVNSVQGEGGKRMVFRSLRLLCHPMARSRWVALYSVDAENPRHRQRFLERLDRLGQRL
jgi:putative NADPH-quinone reductase